MSAKIRFPFFHVIYDDVPAAIKQIVTVLNDSFGALQSYLSRVPRSHLVEIQDTGSANVPFVVLHPLGSVPTFATALTESSANIYATKDDRREWSAVAIKLRCSAANAAVMVRVEG